MLLFQSSGSYGVILDERHFQDLLMEKVRPPEAKVSCMYYTRDMQKTGVFDLANFKEKDNAYI